VLGAGSVPNVVFHRLSLLLAPSGEKGRLQAYSKIMEGFQPAVSAMGTPLAIDTCGARCAEDIITRDCTAGESLLGSTPPAEMGGEMG
jgi:hypothetical protein